MASLIETTAVPIRTAHENTVAVVGLGYVGLPTALALVAGGTQVIGLEAAPERIAAIADRDVDLLDADHERLANTTHDDFRLTLDPERLQEAGTVLICVPTPVDEDARPDLRALKAACATVVDHARPGQTIVLTSTTYVGTTRELLVEPLAARGLHAGTDVHVAFAPERIDPGVAAHAPEDVPRVVGGATPECAGRATTVLERTADRVHTVSSLEAAELSKLYENTFRAVNIALANELATLALDLDVDPLEVTGAAATKPYGYMPFFPGAGVGGHCIPCDPHYLLHSVPQGASQAPLVGQAMLNIAGRPTQVAEKALSFNPQRVLIIGAAYKPGVADIREAPSLDIATTLAAEGVQVTLHDPLVDAYAADPGTDFDLAIVVTVHPGQDIGWLREIPRVLDATHRTGHEAV